MEQNRHIVGLQLALEIAQDSTMKKRVGCIIVDRRASRIVCSSTNHTVGFPVLGTNGKMHRVTMHSEMAAIEQLCTSLGRIQDIHSTLRAQRYQHCSLRPYSRREKPKVGIAAKAQASF